MRTVCHLHTTLSVIKRYSFTTANGCSEASDQCPCSFEVKISYASICFYFTDYKLLYQRLLTQGNVLGRAARRNQ